MTTNYTAEYLASLVHELSKLPQETEWVEFKVNNADPQEIGEYISALSNSAALVGKAFAYLIWGVEDSAHTLVGTSFKPHAARVGNEELENGFCGCSRPRFTFAFWKRTSRGRPSSCWRSSALTGSRFNSAAWNISALARTRKS